MASPDSCKNSSRLSYKMKPYCIEFRCSPYHQNSAFHPILEHLQRLLQFAQDDTHRSSLQTSTDPFPLPFPSGRYFSADGGLALVAASGRGTTSDTESPKTEAEDARSISGVDHRGSGKGTVYCAWEDLHWADPSTLEVLTLFLEQIPTSRVFSVLTFRPEFTPPWNPRSYLTQLTLNRLRRSHVEAMVENVSGR